MIGIAEATGPVELSLDAAEVTGIAGVLVGIEPFAKEIVRHVLDGIQAEPVRFGAIQFPAGSTNQVAAHVLGEGGFSGFNVILGLRAELDGGGVGTEFGAGLIDEHPEVGLLAILIDVVLFGAVEVPDEGVFDLVVPLVDAVIGVGGFVGDVDQVGEAKVEDLPFRVPIAAIIPFPVKPVFGPANVKILRHHAGIDVDGGALVVAGNIKGPVVHDVVKINADAKAVGGGDHFQKFRLGPVAGADRVALVFRAEIKRVPQVVSDRKTAGTFRGWR